MQYESYYAKCPIIMNLGSLITTIKKTFGFFGCDSDSVNRKQDVKSKKKSSQYTVHKIISP